MAVIDKSEAKKKQTIKGTNDADSLYGSRFSDKIYSGNGIDYIEPGKGNDQIYINGTGDKTIYLSKAGSGNNTVTIKNGSDRINLCVNNSYEIKNNYYNTYYYQNYSSYTKRGNDLNLELRYGFWDDETEEYLSGADNILVKNYFDENCDYSDRVYFEVGGIENVSLKNLISTTSINHGFINVYGDKKRNVVATNYHDLIFGTNKKDNILTGAGWDTIRAGAGNDLITLNGNGTKYIEMINGSGNDTISCTDVTSTIRLKYHPSAALGYEHKDGSNDLIIYKTYEKGKSTYTEKTIIKDAYKYEPDLYINDIQFKSDFLALSPYVPVNVKGRKELNNNYNYRTVKGSKKADNLTLNGVINANIFAGAGNDTITVDGANNTRIYGGAGNDRIVVNSTGSTGITIDHTTGAGNDTISVNNSDAKVFINLSMDSSDFNYDETQNYYDRYYDSDYFIASRTGFKREGDNLVMQIPNGYSKLETITFENYYTNPENYTNVRFQNVSVNGDIDYNDSVYSSSYSSLNTLLSYYPIWNVGVKDDTYPKYDIVYQLKYGVNNYCEYAGKGKAFINDSRGADNFLITLNKKSHVTINENYYNGEHSWDTMFIQNDQSKLRFFFNVDSSGKINRTGTTAFDDNLMIYDSSVFTAKNIKATISGVNAGGVGVINIDSFFKKNDTEDHFVEGDGYASLYASKNIKEEAMNDTLYDCYVSQNIYDYVAYNVGQWLSQNGKTSAFDVLQNGTAKEVKQLLALYVSPADVPLVM